MGNRKKKLRKKRKSLAGSVPPFSFEFRLQVARLRKEEGYPADLLAEQFGISTDSVYRWGERYRLYGQQGLMNRPRGKSVSRMPAGNGDPIDHRFEKAKPGPGRAANIGYSQTILFSENLAFNGPTNTA